MGGRFGGSVQTTGRAAAATLLLLLVQLSIFGADTPRLVYADNGAWESDLLVRATGTEPARFRATNCPVGPSGIDLTLGPDESAVLEQYGKRFCGAPIGVVPVETTGHLSYTVYARYHDSEGNTTAFEIPPLTWALRAGATCEVPLIRSNTEHDLALAVFNEGTAPTVLAIAIFGPAGELVEERSVSIDQGLNFFSIATAVDVGRLELEQRSVVGCAGCSFDEPLYGFAAVGSRAQGAQRIIPFGPKVRVATLPEGR